MKKEIRVIKIDGGYIESSQYSQGEFSYTTTDDILKAENLFDMNDNGQFLIECSVSRGGTIEEYIVTARRTR